MGDVRCASRSCGGGGSDCHWKLPAPPRPVLVYGPQGDDDEDDEAVEVKVSGLMSEGSDSGEGEGGASTGGGLMDSE